ncbi:hypothetical protein A3A46_03135 [Candidatus Roizmanbacteria bacterium RIFCSPLOWO2_01_FULL_37_13]|uniref:Uncharacterized protein n=1 Tax=Candidatus Roizmanbacteria bacterium RIFCSPHIGHO2_02_FULL_38_11 TaxID=1802039 RepID=A0A1F7GX54_9BACT|nr:MAG: hypothetical protein A3C25_01970 [Candidatus Roizmanbacteria bacterium RIFCSPHIGHO2_02_FULL_38_11]OGK43127.1 MAG: hypothetical protein A3A46_03135 [Candidatus Roizmanbacteria bacterium RIFCSPLOWO2_01_FULL_37_13]
MEDIISNQNLIHDLDSKTVENTFTLPKFFSILTVVTVAGLIIGFLFSLTKKTITTDNQVGSKSAKVEKTAGIADKKTFKDKAEGILKEGGLDGEGNFHLERPGGESQNVYLTSTTVDLSQYTGKKIRVWGETFQAEKAGWLMDVGLVEVLQ